MAQSAQQFMKENTAPSYPTVKFKSVGMAVVGKVDGEPRVVETEDIDGTKGEVTPKLVINITITPEYADKCTAVYTEKDANGNEIGDKPLVVGETYSIWARARTSMLRAIAEAVGAGTGDKNQTVPAENGILGLQYTGDGVKKQAAFNAPKLFAAQYAAPARTQTVASLI